MSQNRHVRAENRQKEYETVSKLTKSARSRGKHRYPNVKTPWHKIRRAVTYQLHNARLWVREQLTDLQDILAELKEKKN